MTLPVEAGLHRSCCLIDTASLSHNISVLKKGLAPGAEIAAVVKSNAYGHGVRIAWRAFVEGGATWLCVDSLHEAQELRDDGYTGNLFVMGHIPPAHAKTAVSLDVRCMVYDRRQIDALGEAANAASRPLRLVMKLETGTQRQGLTIEAALNLAHYIARFPYLVLEGTATHFANIEDTTDHSFAYEQLRIFNEYNDILTANGFRPTLRTIANSAAGILWPHTHCELVRAGITCYGMWPSTECYVSARLLGKDVDLRPALTWKTLIAQIKTVPAGSLIGYGCTYETTHESRIAVLPVGYYDGYDRAMSNLAYVLIRGKRAPIRGRICMNMCMVDVTDIPDAEPGDDVVLLGRQGGECLSAEQLATWAGTINYELTTQIQTNIPRIAV
ncbi:MAG: alanine racemase [Bradymonadia bacterium]